MKFGKYTQTVGYKMWEKNIFISKHGGNSWHVDL